MSDPIPIQLTTLTGPPFITIIMNWMLFGVLSIQIYLYSQAFPRERSTFKALVYGVYLLEIVQTFLLTGTAWSMLVSGFGDINGIDEIGTTWLSICLIGGTVALLVQWFYAFRIAVFSQNWIMPGFIVLMSLGSVIGAYASAANGKEAGRFSELLRAETRRGAIPVIALWHGIGSACDVVIAGCMCFYTQSLWNVLQNSGPIVKTGSVDYRDWGSDSGQKNAGDVTQANPLAIVDLSEFI